MLIRDPHDPGRGLSVTQKTGSPHTPNTPACASQPLDWEKHVSAQKPPTGPCSLTAARKARDAKSAYTGGKQVKGESTTRRDHLEFKLHNLGWTTLYEPLGRVAVTLSCRLCRMEVETAPPTVTGRGGITS